MKKRKNKFYNTKWFMWLWLIFFPPVGLILLWTCHKQTKQKTKIILSIVFALWFFILISAMGDETNETSDDTTSQTQEQSEDSETNETSDDTISQIQEQSEDKEESSIYDDINFILLDVPNDVTGNWKVATIADNIQMQDFALDYYKEHFESDDEIHAIVNFNYNTTTKISVMGNLLDVTIYEYVEKEQHDANLLFSGMLLKEYHVNIDTEKIEEIQ